MFVIGDEQGERLVSLIQQSDTHPRPTHEYANESVVLTNLGTIKIIASVMCLE